MTDFSKIKTDAPFGHIRFYFADYAVMAAQPYPMKISNADWIMAAQLTRTHCIFLLSLPASCRVYNPGGFITDVFVCIFETFFCGR